MRSTPDEAALFCSSLIRSWPIPLLLNSFFTAIFVSSPSSNETYVHSYPNISPSSSATRIILCYILRASIKPFCDHGIEKLWLSIAATDFISSGSMGLFNIFENYAPFPVSPFQPVKVLGIPVCAHTPVQPFLPRKVSAQGMPLLKPSVYCTLPGQNHTAR